MVGFGDFQNKITTVIKVEGADKAGRAFKNVTRTTQTFKEGMERTNTVLTRTKGAMKNVTKTTKNVTTSFRRFKAELLSVLFFGMALQRLFLGLLKPAFDLVGLFDLFSVILGILFLPIALSVLEVLLPIGDALIGLSDPVKKAMGVFALLGAILGTVFLLFGIIGLGIAGMRQVFGPLFKTIKLTGGIFRFLAGLLTGTVLVAFAIIAVALIGFWLAWKDNFGKIKDWVMVIFIGIKQILTGVGQIFTGIFDVIMGLFSGNSDRILQGFKELGFGIANVFVGLIKTLVGLLVTLGLSILRVITGIIKSVVGLFFKAVDAVKGLLGFGGGPNKVKGKKQFGGFIPQEGLYHLHAGETVVPANQTISSSPTINIFTSGGIDSGTIDKLKRELGEIIANDLARLSRR